LECVKYLVSKGAEIDAKNVDNLTPRHIATQNGHLECEKYLAEKGAKIDVRNVQNDSTF